MKQNKGIAISLAVVVFLGLLFASAKTVITVKGSDTMVILAQRWAEIYMSSHSEVTLQVTGGGSGVGISALINGTTDICNSSRQIKKSEIEKIKQRYNSLGVEIPVAKDGITVFLHTSNPVSELSIEQLKSIYTGQITNWKDIGGPDQKIILYGRENSSGTYVYFRDHVLEGQDFISTVQGLPGTAAVVNAISKDQFGIGYGGAAFAEGVKIASIKKDNQSAAFQPNPESIKNDTYPLSRPLYMYLRNKPTGETQKFIEWVLSPAGQEVVTKVGYFPVN